jgi:enterochelin esterase-like enzyme
MKSKSWTVAVVDGSETLYALDGTGTAWTSSLGLAPQLDETARDGAIAAARAAGMPYTVTERTRHPLGSTPAFTDSAWRA